MTTLDTAIQTALGDLGVSWCPAMWQPVGDNKPNEFYLWIRETENFPSLIQAVEDDIIQLENGMAERTISFYMFDIISPYDNDVLDEINPIYENLTSLVFQFKNLLADYSAEFVGGLVKTSHTLATVSEAGINFRLKVKYYLCSQ